MKKITSFCMMAGLLWAGQSQAQIFFSEYAEGTVGNNKYIEIANAGSTSVSLDDYMLVNNSNAPDAGKAFDFDNTYMIAGVTLGPGEVYVIANEAADQPILSKADTAFQYVSFNGDDWWAILKASDSSVVDEIGTSAADPGSGWDVAGVTDGTKDHTLVRKPGITMGNTWDKSAGTDAASSEWIVYDGPTDVDVYGSIGTHQFKALRMVKFSVDMSNETISANGVHVAGSFQGWDKSGTPMSDEGNGIYSVYAEVDADAVIEFKYLNDNDWAGVESVPAISQKGHTNNGESNDNRWFYSGSGSDTLMLPAFVFSGSAPSGQSAVRFAVDMKNETVSSNGVHLAGSLQNWDPSKDQMANLYSSNSIYEIIFCLADGSYEYKFVNDDNWNNGGAESVPSSCATNGNRGLTVSSADAAEKLVCFGSCDACPGAAIPKVKVTFQVDMANECDVDGVDIAGGKINGWSGGDMLTKMAENICGVPVAPHDGSNAGNWTDNGDGTFSVNGKGNFIGLPKVYTGGEISNPADAKDTITYEYTITSGDKMSVYCPIANGAYWQFDLQKATSDSMLSGSWNMTFMGVGPSKGDVSWWNTAIDENNRPCMADDQFNLNSDGSFKNVFGPTTWIEGWQLVKPDVYFITLELDSGVEIEHKFRKITNVDGVDLVSWESDAASGGNYKVTAHNDTIIAARCFGKEEACSGTPLAPANITFTVDLSQEIPADTVWIMGSFTTPQWQAGAIALEQDATNSDLYTVTVENVCADKMSYKFANEAMNSSTNGETFPDSTDRSCVVDNGQGGWNRTLTRTDDQDIIVSYTYNTCQPAGSANTTDLSTEMSIAPNPANGIFTVKLAGSKINSVEILSIDGRTIRSYNSNSMSTSIDATGLNGIFLVKVSDNIGRTAIKKIVLQ